MLEFVDRWKIY